MSINKYQQIAGLIPQPQVSRTRTGNAIGGLLSGLQGYYGGRGLLESLEQEKVADAKQAEADKIAEQDRKFKYLTGGINPYEIDNQEYAEQFLAKANEPSSPTSNTEWAYNIARAEDSGAPQDEIDALIMDRLKTQAKGYDTLQGQAYATAQGRGMGTIPTARAIEREKTIGKELLQEAPTGELTPVAGSPRDLAAKKVAKEKSDSAELARQTASVITTKIKDIRDILRGGGISEGVRGTTGIQSYATSWLTGSKANKVRNALDTVKSNVALNKLLEIKGAGGTFGALSEKELQKLEDSMGKLSMRLSEKEMDETLAFIDSVYQKALQSSVTGDLEADIEAALSGGATNTSPSSDETLEAIAREIYGG